MSAPSHLALPALGLIVLRVDETIEHEFRRLVPHGSARLHVTRIDSGDDLTPDSISQMEQRLTDAAAMLPSAAGFDVVGYACTSGTAFLGHENVRQRVMDGIPTRAVTDPLTAAIAQMSHLNVTRIGLVSPYVEEVAGVLIEAFEARGVSVTASVALNERNEAQVARMGANQVVEAARSVMSKAACDALFLSCTNLNTLALLDDLSSEFGVPVLSSNQALAWHMKRQAGITT